MLPADMAPIRNGSALRQLIAVGDRMLAVRAVALEYDACLLGARWLQAALDHSRAFLLLTDAGSTHIALVHSRSVLEIAACMQVLLGVEHPTSDDHRRRVMRVIGAHYLLEMRAQRVDRLAEGDAPEFQQKMIAALDRDLALLSDVRDLLLKAQGKRKHLPSWHVLFGYPSITSMIPLFEREWNYSSYSKAAHSSSAWAHIEGDGVGLWAKSDLLAKTGTALPASFDVIDHLGWACFLYLREYGRQDAPSVEGWNRFLGEFGPLSPCLSPEVHRDFVPWW